MAFRFRIIRCLRVNFSESGAGTSAADRGLWSTTSPHGIGAGRELPYVVIERTHKPARALGLVLLLIALVGLAFVVAAQG
jgi:hypothetical protein